MLSLLFLFISIALLSLSMHKHYKATFNAPLTEGARHKLKIFGWLTLLVSVILVTPNPINYVTWLTELSLIIILQSWFLTKIQRHNER